MWTNATFEMWNKKIVYVRSELISLENIYIYSLTFAAVPVIYFFFKFQFFMYAHNLQYI